MDRRFWLVVSLLSCVSTWACKAEEDAGDDITPDGDSDTTTDQDPNNGVKPPAPYDTLTFTLSDVEVDNPERAAGFQGKLVRAADGTLFYAYLKQDKVTPLCDIAVFAGDAAPGVPYNVKVAVKGPSDTAFTVESIPLASVPSGGNVPYMTGRNGIDAAVNPSGQLVVAFPGGGAGLFTCGSSDLVLATRTGAGTYTFAVPVTGSGAYGTVCADKECCSDPACSQGQDAGTWPSVAFSGAGALGVAYVDSHNVVDEDGSNWQGYEFYESGSVSGIRPWSGSGAYGDLLHDGTTWITAFSKFNGGGLTVLKNNGTKWEGSDLRPGWGIGERVSLAQAANGRVGLVFFARTNNQGQEVWDLSYCYSDDGGSTWSTPCESIDTRALRLGANPSLAFDSQSRPVVSYYFCGADVACSQDGVRFAWRADDGKWWLFNVHNVNNNRSGYYSSVVLDPTTDEPTIVFQDLTRGAAMVAQGKFGN